MPDQETYGGHPAHNKPVLRTGKKFQGATSPFQTIQLPFCHVNQLNHGGATVGLSWSFWQYDGDTLCFADDLR
jgi:hypothetical protein